MADTIEFDHYPTIAELDAIEKDRGMKLMEVDEWRFYDMAPRRFVRCLDSDGAPADKWVARFAVSSAHP